ncbi:ATP-dependent Clp protease proteolytic subunit [Kordia sp. SMS9]|uniref:Clp protease ClpP n=1 Tax=Kordia sp. SMS9 TaxID=2282170 RepID=UPI000E0DF867|nr:Clp protease ClpP [Kordia sp. SMS9]AXG70440.1 ATP-dependent Clp protease proteolytic subunit [Kordia sp. SMS9]
MILKVDQNNIHIYGYIYGGDGVRFLSEFSKVDGTYPEIEVWIHCYGGWVFDGNMIYNTLIGAKSTVNTNTIGVAASMGGIIASAGKTRRIVSNGFLMIHAPTGGTYGTASDHLKAGNLLTELEKQFVKLLVAKTKKTAKDVKKWLVGDNWFSAEQAKASGLVDEIIDPEAILDVDIDDPQEIGSEEIYNRFAASLDIKDIRPEASVPINKPVIIEPLNNDDTMKKDVIDALGLSGVTAQSSDTAVITAIKEHYQAKQQDLQKKYDDEKTDHDALKAKVKADEENALKSILDQAQNIDKKFTAEERSTYEQVGKDAGIKALNTVLSKIGVRQTITSQIPSGGNAPVTASRQGWNWDKYQEEDPRALEAMKATNLDEFKALFKAKYNVDFED